MSYISHKMGKILVSVVICGYDREDFIQDAIKSVLKQTFDK
jgi:glycosyltransferase involved in cell wall biosynthesis